MMRRMMGSLAVTALVGCGSALPPFEGEVAGYALEMRDAAAVRLSDAETGESALFIVLSDREGLCDRLKAGRRAPGATELTFVLASVDASMSPQGAAPGLYKVQALTEGTAPADPNLAQARFHRRTSRCTEEVPEARGRAVSGVVSLESGGQGEQGPVGVWYSLDFGPQGDHAEGRFEAKPCDAEIPAPEALECR